MLPAGGVKGAMLALVVELLCAALTGARLGFEADSFFGDGGNRPRIGQGFLVLDPDAFAGRDAFGERVETLLAVMLQDPDVRIPGYRRDRLAEKAQSEGIEVGAPLLAQLRKAAGEGEAEAAG
jgi:(2R)-3-sulfolactate dehydrogenase (NADP+)